MGTHSTSVSRIVIYLTVQLCNGDMMIFLDRNTYSFPNKNVVVFDGTTTICFKLMRLRPIQECRPTPHEYVQLFTPTDSDVRCIRDIPTQFPTQRNITHTKLLVLLSQTKKIIA